MEDSQYIKGNVKLASHIEYIPQDQIKDFFIRVKKRNEERSFRYNKTKRSAEKKENCIW